MLSLDRVDTHSMALLEIPRQSSNVAQRTRGWLFVKMSLGLVRNLPEFIFGVPKLNSVPHENKQLVAAIQLGFLNTLSCPSNLLTAS